MEEYKSRDDLLKELAVLEGKYQALSTHHEYVKALLQTMMVSFTEPSNKKRKIDE